MTTATVEATKPISYTCPYCNTRLVETTATAPYVRGFLVAYQIGSKSFIGCKQCVRGKVLKEAGLSSLVGWFSLSALVVNPFLITYNLLRAPLVRTNYASARKRLRAAGIPEDQEDVDVTRLAYGLALSMIAADGKIEASEVEAAIVVGKEIFPDFDQNEFEELLGEGKWPAPQDVARMMRDILTDEGKKAVCTYLMVIAQADGHVDDSEIQLLNRVAQNMGYEPESSE